MILFESIYSLNLPMHSSGDYWYHLSYLAAGFHHFYLLVNRVHSFRRWFLVIDLCKWLNFPFIRRYILSFSLSRIISIYETIRRRGIDSGTHDQPSSSNRAASTRHMSIVQHGPLSSPSSTTDGDSIRMSVPNCFASPNMANVLRWDRYLCICISKLMRKNEKSTEKEIYWSLLINR